MPQDEDFLLRELMNVKDGMRDISIALATAVASINGKIDGFMQGQSAQQAEINGLKNRVSTAEADITSIKTTHSTIRNRILGGSAVVSVVVGGLMTFGWPILQKKFGL